ncbi:MAG: PhoH family protein [Candidatus Competibacteraceae bacterium]|nr:PhoH family protein [Candidatus Competibacteraceae bacterium]
MSEKIIIIESLDAVGFYGVHNQHLKTIRKYFPKLQLVARGNELKVIGTYEEIDAFQEKFLQMLNYFEKFGKMNEDAIEAICGQNNSSFDKEKNLDTSIVLYGNDGLIIKPRTQNQLKLVEAIGGNDLVFAIGPAGTGKTYLAVAMAVKALKAKEVRRIILTRPAVEAGENLGFLPGDLNEKLAPYLQPLFDALRDMIPAEKLKMYNESGIIQVAPLAYMRGRTLDNAFVILDEAQNATSNQMKMFLTRMGKSAKFVVTGDITQIDLPRNQRSGLAESMKLLEKIKGIQFVQFGEKDVVRHDLVRKILNAYNKFEIIK